MARPLIGTGNGDEVREMTDEELESYEKTISESQHLPGAE